MPKKSKTSLVSRMWKYSTKWYVQWGVALVIFSTCIGVYMGKSVTQCTEIYYGMPSDATGGLAWFQWADSNDPIWDSTDKSNFPVGESLKRPQFVTSYAQYFPYWLFAVLTNQFCALNIMVFLGFLSTALAMFGLVRWLTRSFPVAIFSGYAAAFVPYHVLKASSHIAYNYSVFFILMIWLTLGFYKKPSYKLAVAIAAVFGISFYFDGYFILISTVVLATLVGALMVRYLVEVGYERGRLSITLTLAAFVTYIKNHIKYYAVALIALGMILAPLAYIAKTKGSQIQSGLNSSRSQIKEEANIYGARIDDYVLPSASHPWLYGDYSNWRIHNIHNSNITENTLYIGYTIIALALFGFIASCTFRRAEARKFRFAIVASILIIVVGMLVSAPPVMKIGGINVYMPSALLISISESWRVLSRLFLIVHTAWVVLAALGLYLLTINRKTVFKVVAISIVSILLVLEFLPNPYPPSWIPKRDVPGVYFQIKKDSSIKAIAEYPIIDNPSATLPYTFTFQQFHEKPILNANDTNTPQKYVRQSIAGLSDAQTIKVLRGLGINMVTTYGINASGIPGLQQYAKPDASAQSLEWKIYSYRILDGVANRYVLTPRDGFTLQMNTAKTKSLFTMKNVAFLSADPLKAGPSLQKVDIAFTVQSANEGVATLNIEQKGVVLWSGNIKDPQNITLSVKSGEPIKLVSPGYDINSVLYFSDLETLE